MSSGRGVLLALGLQGKKLAEPLGDAAALAPVVAVAALAFVLVAADLLARGSPTRRRGTRLG